MKNIQNKLIIILFISLIFPHLGSSQYSSVDELRFDVKKIYPNVSITKEKLKDAQSIIDLNERYKSSWVRTYISVEIQTKYNGVIRKSVGKNDQLTQEQKEHIFTADLGTDILVKVQYIPKNNLKNNPMREMGFAFSIDPDSQAKFPDGTQQLKKYLKEKAISKIPEGYFKNYDLAAIKFTVTTEGQIINTNIFQTSNDEKIDELLVETISNMPYWTPAQYSDGTKINQEYVLTVGSMENCMLNLLNIRGD